MKRRECFSSLYRGGRPLLMKKRECLCKGTSAYLLHIEEAYSFSHNSRKLPQTQILKMTFPEEKKPPGHFFIFFCFGNSQKQTAPQMTFPKRKNRGTFFLFFCFGKVILRIWVCGNFQWFRGAEALWRPSTCVRAADTADHIAGDGGPHSLVCA